MSAPTLDATVAGDAANSYVARDRAAALLAVRPGGATGWTNANDAERDLALMQATTILEREPWTGLPATGLQALAWPRVGVDAVGLAIDGDGIPIGIQQATAELAEQILSGVPTPTTPSGLATLAGVVKSVKAGPITLDLTGGGGASAETSGSTLPLVVRQWVMRYLRSFSTLPPTSNLGVVRAA